MSEQGFWPTLSAIGVGIIGVATLALVVSKNSNTSDVIDATSNGYSNALATALSPVTGHYPTNLSSGGSSFPIS